MLRALRLTHGHVPRRHQRLRPCDLRPGLPTLFISGYAEELVDRAEGDPARVLEKPFDADSLATAVRASLDANRPGVS